MKETQDITPQPDKNTASAFMARSFVFQRDKKYEQALAEADAFIAQFPQSCCGYEAKVQVFRQLKMFDEALAETDALIAKFPESYCGYRAKAQVFRQMKLFDAAIAAASEAVRYSPQDEHVYFTSNFLVADLYVKAGLLDKAIPHLQIAANEKSSRRIHANWYLCEIYIRLGDGSNAAIYLDRLPSDFSDMYEWGRKETTRAFLEEQVAAMKKQA